EAFRLRGRSLRNGLLDLDGLLNGLLRDYRRRRGGNLVYGWNERLSLLLLRSRLSLRGYPAQAGYKMAAYTTFQEAVSEYPGEVEAWVWLGGTSPSLDEAELAFKRACELDPGNEEATVGLRWVALRRRVVAESPHAQNGNGVRPAEFVGASVAAGAGAPEAPWEPEQKQAKPSFFSRLFGKKG
ncbi:MAG TPA: hypothetical protein VFG99_02600, partial [Chloroflexia bacterium]|nr:hypothetical protein [Chloroflexia bacterium]